MNDSKIDWFMVLQEIKNIYASVDKLSNQFPGRHFTPDGHLIGTIGEVVASYVFELVLAKASNRGCDAFDQKTGRPVEIKCTQGKRVSFYDCDLLTNVIVLTINEDRTFRCVFNGLFSDLSNYLGDIQKNGQRTISVIKLEKIQESVSSENMIEQIHPLPTIKI